VPSYLKRHVHAKHSHLCEKPVNYFKRLVVDQTSQAKEWTILTIISDKAQEESYAIAKIVVKRQNHMQLLS
jgi:hypothetical protein